VSVLIISKYSYHTPPAYLSALCRYLAVSLSLTTKCRYLYLDLEGMRCLFRNSDVSHAGVDENSGPNLRS